MTIPKNFINLNSFCTKNDFELNTIMKICKKYKVILVKFGPSLYVELSDIEVAISNFFNDRVDYIKKKRVPRKK